MMGGCCMWCDGHYLDLIGYNEDGYVGMRLVLVPCNY